MGRGTAGLGGPGDGAGGSTRGVGVARAAISVVNALPLGIGAAAAIDWPARVAAGVRATPFERRRVELCSGAPCSRLVRATGSAALRRYAAGPARLSLEIRSTIPVARGLKSSSAVAGAIAEATARASGADPEPLDLATLASTAEIRSGGSATGAFDDALASVAGGGVVTENASRRVLRRFELGSEYGVALWVPDAPHPPSASVRARFRRDARLAHRAVDAALEGRWAEAIAANTALVERAMGYPYARLRRAAASAGAVAAGVSGMGPTLFAIAPTRRLPRVLATFPSTSGARRVARLYRAKRPRRTGGRS